MAGIMLYEVARKLSKEPRELMDVIKRMSGEGIEFSFDIQDLKVTQGLEQEDEEKVLGFFERKQAEEKAQEKIILRDGKKIKVRRRKRSSDQAGHVEAVDEIADEKELIARMEAERKALEAERKALEIEAKEKEKLEAELRAKENAKRKAQEDAARKSLEEEKRREDAKRKEKEQSERKAKEEAKKHKENKDKGSSDDKNHRGTRKKVITMKEIETMETTEKRRRTPAKTAPAATTSKPGVKEDPRKRKATTTKGAPVKRQGNQKTVIYNTSQLADYEDSLERGRKKRRRGKKKREKTKIEPTVPKASKRIVRLAGDTVSISDLAKEMNQKAALLVQELFKQGVVATINQMVDLDTAVILANEFNYEIKQVGFDVDALLKVPELDKAGKSIEKVHRAPIVTVMGHVDHGKTKLLDAIRKTNVVDGEAGGITQHIGAYSVNTSRGPITFLDTPGHEAFTAMRARGANVTDLVILIVAADDGVMPQTVEAINHAKAAKVPIIVAINKIDKPDVNPEKIKEELTAYELVAEEWGGDVMFCKISAKFNMGIEALLETVLLQAEMLELEAVKDQDARATVIEAFIDKGKGAVTNILVTEGTLKRGDFVVAGGTFGKIRAMFNDKGEPISEAGPSRAVSVLGLNGVPNAGEPFYATKDEKTARSIGEHYQRTRRDEDLNRRTVLTTENLFDQLKENEIKVLTIIVKADVQGSVEAVRNVLTRLSNDAVRVNVIHAGVGGIIENDLNLAIASNSIVVGFNVRPVPGVQDLADKNGIDVRLFSVIYDMENDIKRATMGLLDPVIKEVHLGRAEVRETFNITKIGTIAGCIVRSGMITRDASIRLVRDSIVIAEDKMKSLKRFKDDVKEVKEGYECGISLQKYNDIKIGDIFEAYTHKEEQPTL